MPKNQGKGGKKKRRGKSDANFVVRELILKDGEDQEYAQVVKLLGNGRLEARCFKKNMVDDKFIDFKSKNRICLIRGSMRKRIWIATNDLILVSLREFDDEKGDVIHKYEEHEAKKLIRRGAIPNIVFNSHVNEDKNKNNKNNQNNDAENVTVKEEQILFENSDSDDDIIIDNL